jgi:D-alanyl-D-alanine dipeptidase
MDLKPTIRCIFFIVILIFSACNDNKSKEKKINYGDTILKKELPDTIIKVSKPEIKLLDTLTALFKNKDLVDVTLFSDEFILDIRYATPNNFLDSILYPCAKCLLRYEILKDLLKAQSEFKSLGFKVKLYDCYRPLSVQKIMWKKYPVVGLVADPATGSRHNRGSAIDISLTDSLGKDIDMGTKYDDLSKPSRSFYTGFDEAIINNRMLLRKILEKHHFIGINSEWWHFSHNCGTKYPVSDEAFDCDTLTNK